MAPPFAITRGAATARGYGLFAQQATAGAVDTYFPYVTLLLPGNGTNGAQNNTFLDSSTNNFSITRNGNTTQGTFSPYGSNWGNYFDGSSYLAVPSNSALGLGAGDYTVEAWVYITTDVTYAPVIAGTTGGSTWLLEYSNARGLAFYDGTASFYSSTGFQANAWVHLSVTRASSALKLFINGSVVATGTSTYNNSAAAMNIGAYTDTALYDLKGYISNLRVVKGTAVYTGAFTPPTAPLTAITNTSLLTCQSNRFIDNSANAFAITVNGSPSVQRFSPFNPTAPYSTSVIGGSGYFDGSGDSLSCTGSLPATGDFTLSMWVYPSSLPGYALALTQAGSGNAFYLYLGYSDGKIDIQVGGSAYADYTAGVYKANQWNYVQVVKSSSAYSVYVNGTALSVIGSSGNIGTTSIASGTLTVSYNTGCYITDVRIVTSALSNTVPTAPLTAVSGTTMLLSMQNAGILDNAEMNDLETVGSAQISTAQSKFGGSSMYFDGTGDYLTSPNNPYGNFGSSDWTIEFWVNSTQTSRVDPFGWNYAYTSAGWGGVILNVSASGQMSWYEQTSQRINATGTNWNNGAWNHIAVTRSGNSVRMFFNGTQVGSTYTTSFSYGANNSGFIIGVNNDGSGPLNGYIDDLRITKGIARYTSSFTPPTAAFPTR